MSGIIQGLVVLALLVVLFGWLASRAWRARRGWIKWPGVILAGLLALVFILLTATGAYGTYKLFRKYTVSVPTMTAAGTPDQVQRGQHIAQILCVGCHSLNGDLPLSGGKNLSADAGLPLGDIYSANLTPGADIKNWTDTDIFRAIRTGIDDQGRATAMVGVAAPHTLSDEDTLAVIAFLRQSPAVANTIPAYKPSVLTAVLTGAGLIPSPQLNVTAQSAPAKAASAEYGKYVLGFMDCTSCHGQKLDGNAAPPNPAGPDIRHYLSTWTKDDFFNVVHAFASSSQPSDVMPWKDISRLDDVELEALYLYLHQATVK